MVCITLPEIVVQSFAAACNTLHISYLYFVIIHLRQICRFLSFHSYSVPHSQSKDKTLLVPVLAIFAGMKKILFKFRKWYYRRLYTQLLFAYLKREKTANSAHVYANEAFMAINGFPYSDILCE